ncbi:hypothetical protein F4774DRAFT_392999 [Daldinia eschscholtzii]|nr:hypothetical protein F4774DRAFT_392999 [Daldinia eschscholtzii]
MDAPRDTIVLDRANFEILVQRARVANDYQLGDNRTPGNVGPLMCLPMDEYEDLILARRHYTNLIRRLMQEGMTEENLAVLSQDDPRDPQANKTMYDVPDMGKQNAPTASYNRREDRAFSADNQAKPRFSPSGIQPRSREQWRQDPNGNRGLISLYFKGLAADFTYWDVTSAIRGGSLSHLKLVPSTEEAFVSFVKEEDAMSFYNYVRKNDFYVKQRKVHVTWARHQRYIAGDVAAQIRRGASRNLLIPDCEGKLTEREIRQDMAHIETLIIIKVIFSDGHCHIKTNSIFDAMVAKMCMQSRRKYKQWTVQWDHDECSEPFGESQESRPTKQQAGTSKERFASRGQNRFASLRTDDDNNV